jgi:hypothetical protein
MDSTVSNAVSIIISLVLIAAMWQVFTKAGRPGWGAIIPVYNLYLLVKIAGRPGWWVVLYLVPVVNVVAHLLVSLDLARSFGRSKAFGVVGLWLFSVIGLAILGFGGARYTGLDRAGQDSAAFAH